MSERADSKRATLAENGSSSSRSNLVLPVILLMAIGLLAGCGLLWLSAEILDRKSEVSARNLVQSFLRKETKRLSTLALDYTWWDTPFDSILDKLDRQWAEENIGGYFAEVYDVASSFAVDDKDKTIIGFVAGEPVSDSAHDVIGASLPSLIQLARSGSRERPRPATSYIWVGSEVQMISVSPFTSEAQEVAVSQSDQRAVLIVTRTLDKAFLDDIARTIGIEDLVIRPSKPSGEFSGLPLLGLGGQIIGYLSWNWSKPGEALLWRLAPALGSALAAMIYLLYIFFRSTDVVLERQARLVSSLRRERELRELKTRFISMVSHELRTPLATIRSAADLLDRYEDRMSKDDRRNEVGAIRTAVDGLTRLLENVMVIGRSDSKAPSGNSAVVHLGDFCQQVWDEVVPTLESEQSLIIKCSSNKVTIEVDVTYMRAMLSNLFQNAVKYAPGSKDIVVEIEPTLENYTLRVVDFGEGIAKDERDVIFEPFQRGRGSGNVSGTGLGLAVARASATSLGGTLKIVERPNCGAIFEAILPYRNTSAS